LLAVLHGIVSTSGERRNGGMTKMRWGTGAFWVRHGLAVIAHLWAKMFHRIAARFTISLIFGSFRV